MFDTCSQDVRLSWPAVKSDLLERQVLLYVVEYNM